MVALQIMRRTAVVVVSEKRYYMAGSIPFFRSFFSPGAECWIGIPPFASGLSHTCGPRPAADPQKIAVALPGGAEPTEPQTHRPTDPQSRWWSSPIFLLFRKLLENCVAWKRRISNSISPAAEKGVEWLRSRVSLIFDLFERWEFSDAKTKWATLSGNVTVVNVRS